MNYTLKQIIGSFILLAVSLISHAQKAEKDSLQTSFDRFQTQALQEKLFVHVDKTFYLAGETIWFKVYDVDAGLHMPLPISGIAYIEIIDKDQKPLLQEKIEMASGKGDGSFRIPSSIPSGHYTFRAYTSWMKNFSPDFYYQQQVTILNTLSEITNADSPRRKEYDLRFFPEGGNLVNGISSAVAFKAVNSSGDGVSCQGLIIDQHKDTVAHFQTGRFGIGKFTFTPVKGNTYSALIETPSSVITSPLPAAYDQGYVMHLDDPGGNSLRITVHASSTSASPLLYLFVHSHNRIKSIQANYPASNVTSFLISKDSLDDGISHLTIFNADRTPVCERLYCKPPTKQLHIAVNAATAPTAASGSAPMPAPAYNTRGKLTVDLSTTDPSGHPVTADLSMSVFLTDSLQSIPGENILSYLLLRSDLKGKIESPEYYFANTDAATTEALDNLMLTQGWTRFRWEDVLQHKIPAFEFLPESNGPIISGKIIDKRTGLPPAPVIGYLSVPGRRFKLSTAISQPDGNIFFHVDDFYGNREIIVQTNSQTDSNDRIDLASSFSDRFAPLHVPDSLISKKAASQLLYRSINVQAENAYRSGVKHHLLSSLDNDTTGFYGEAELQYNLDEYTRFITMDEVIREFVQDVRVRRQSGKAYFRVRDALFNVFFEDDPLLLVDGVPVFNGEKMISINPLRIEKIDVVSHRYHLGPSLTDGLVSFKSYDGDLGGYQLDPSAVVIQLNGLEQHREFYTPVYETPAQIQSSIPDLRNQLLWSPEINTGAAGKKQLPLYTSDLTGNFALVVQGITKDGLAGYSVLTFTVHPDVSSRDVRQ